MNSLTGFFVYGKMLNIKKKKIFLKKFLFQLDFLFLAKIKS